MPTYEYKCECGELIENDSPMNNIKRRVKCPACGKMAPKAIMRPNQIVRHRYIDNSPRKGRGRGF